MKIVAKVTNNPDFVYEMTPGDLDWSLRMIYGESGGDLVDSICVLWCMVNRFVLVKTNWADKGFEKFIRNYSQPINPRWYPGGDLAKYFAGKAPASPDKLARRIQIRDMQDADFPNNLKEVINFWKMGQISNPIPKAIDFAVPSVASKSTGTAGLLQAGLEIIYDKRNRGSSCVDTFGNVFYGNQISTAWVDNKVSIVGDGGLVATDSNVDDIKTFIANNIK